ncbi:hypothetical protein TRFO_02092 [Tritrichomonas foetus]|uniref:Uncharacterized protein n=1 Tax=Tritrichomonas foetus TaxID=1144522 RepID=A0A1J4JH69_9EUKA|nr:hypothetical protein TRFO_02092 [Tritrichomonas foetus]|eukprot:OHS96947.1 hypothetical protein TRFO_02092 [Tritrichomonas foetus]
MSLKEIDSFFNNARNQSNIDIIHRLKKLNHLIKLPSFKSLSELKKTFSIILENSSILEAPSLTVRIYLALCFTEAFSKFAPNIPLTTMKELTAVFGLFSTVIGMSNCGSTEAELVEEIVEILLSTESYYLISDSPISSEIVASMMKMSSKNANDYIVELLNSSKIIENETKRAFAININKNRNVMYILDKLEKKHQIDIIFSLSLFISEKEFFQVFLKLSQSLSIEFGCVALALQEDLISPNDSTRLNAFSMIEKFIKTIQLNITDENSLKFILSRGCDINSQIRRKVCRISSFLTTNPTFSNISIPKLFTFLSDPNEDVKLCALNEIDSHGFDLLDYFYLLNDKSQNVREHFVRIICSNIENGKYSYINRITNQFYQNIKYETFLSFFYIFQKFEANQIYEIVEDSDKFGEILLQMTEIQNKLEIYLTTGNLEPKYISLFGQKIYKFLGIDNFEEFRKEKFSKFYEFPHKSFNDIKNHSKNRVDFEFIVLFQEIPFSPTKILEINNKRMMKLFAKIDSSKFLPFAIQIIGDCHDSIIILPYLNMKFESFVFQRLLEVSSIDSILVFAKILGKNPCYEYKMTFNEKNSLIQFEFNDFCEIVDLDCFDHVVLAKFYYHLKRADIPENLFDSKICDDPHLLKWKLKLSHNFPTNKAIEQHLKLMKSNPCVCFESFLKISPNILLDLTTNQFRIIASCLKKGNPNTRISLVATIDKILKHPKTPIDFLAIIIYAMTDNDDNVAAAAAKRSLIYHKTLREKMIRKNRSFMTTQQIEIAMPAFLNIILFLDHENHQTSFEKIMIFLKYTNNDYVHQIIRSILSLCDSNSNYGQSLSKLCHYIMKNIGVCFKKSEIVFRLNPKFIVSDGNEINPEFSFSKMRIKIR